MNNQLNVKNAVLQVVMIFMIIIMILQNAIYYGTMRERTTDRYTQTQATADKNYYKRRIKDLEKKIDCEDE